MRLSWRQQNHENKLINVWETRTLPVYRIDGKNGIYYPVLSHPDRRRTVVTPLQANGCRPLNGIHVLTGFSGYILSLLFLHKMPVRLAETERGENVFENKINILLCIRGTPGSYLPHTSVEPQGLYTFVCTFVSFSLRFSLSHTHTHSLSLYFSYRFVFIYFLVEKITDFSGRRAHATRPAGQLPPTTLAPLTLIIRRNCSARENTGERRSYTGTTTTATGARGRYAHACVSLSPGARTNTHGYCNVRDLNFFPRHFKPRTRTSFRRLFNVVRVWIPDDHRKTCGPPTSVIVTLSFFIGLRGHIMISCRVHRCPVTIPHAVSCNVHPVQTRDRRFSFRSTWNSTTLWRRR